ncbi:hypothetical protein AMS68_005604 [Peltaster fructicola]|uniref:non-specific serine/threonine protein kinase n=1 Tax=Peltaster fructicola TaxID=286661 RepID=A0A6H0XZA9_9PEZI|nr:hypothetical protein AMS68_005604 [Peltaster fructicola]
MLPIGDDVGMHRKSINAYNTPGLANNLDEAAASALDRNYEAAADSLKTRASVISRRKSANPINERALATLSPAEHNSAVGAPPALGSTASTAGLTSRQPARYLQDWQVEDIILLATVDGSLHARDRNNFASRWQLGSESPMVETTYHRRNKSVDETGQELEDPLWIVEPSQDGSIYVYAPSSAFGMQKLGYTVKQLAELAPYASDGQPAVAYTAEKKTTLYTVDAATGNILKAFSSTGAITNNERSCRTGNPLVDGGVDEGCERIGTITLGRTEYTIGIQDRESGEQISTIRYAEWSPNNRDQDLKNKYTHTKDDNYVYTRHDGTVFRLSAKKTSRASLHHKFSSPVAQVFDVFRANHDVGIDPTLIVLPQPTAPALTDILVDDDYENVFVNCTESGSWYALSELNYPDITHAAPNAKCYESRLPTLPLTKSERRLFTGLHPIAYAPPGKDLDRGGTIPTINPPEITPPSEVLPVAVTPSPSALSWQNILILLLTALISCGAIYGYKQQQALNIPQIAVQPELTTPQVSAVDIVDSKHMVREDEPAKETIFMHTRGSSSELALVEEAQPDDDNAVADTAEGTEETPDNPKKKKATRGKRGGRKQKEKEAAAAEAKAKRLGLEIPESKSVAVISVEASESTQVTGPLQINSLIIHTDKVIGQGSCGTCVFEGSFEGRGVAVKRMLSQYYELASQEVSFLQQSDDHENVIRYYCQQKDNHFLYIAVELCQASLFEVWEAEKAKTEERQLQLHKLKFEIQQDIPRTLQQLAKGLHHLHKLRIIHRDIKPQNILVAFPKKFVDNGPRLVISDFGLGKNPPENVSTLIDPTGNAGTSGWKAPELISQPQAESRHSQASQGANNDSASNGLPAGVKRAADIFSLGCLFFWMLTDGVHPFEDDNGWTQLRELNIKRGLKKMEVLSRWSDAYEPMQLITSMLEQEPENRPTALQVLNHPFFWSPEKRLAFLCDVSDHFEREPRGVWDDGWTGDSYHLRMLEKYSREVIGNGNNFLASLDRIFVDTLGKQRKYSGDRVLDLLRALRNKKNHYEDMSEEVKRRVGPLAGGYLKYWTDKFPRLLMVCYQVIHECGVEGNDRFRGYFEKSS